MFQFMPVEEPVREYRNPAHVDMEAFKRIQIELLHRRVMMDEEPMFPCFSHNKDDLEQTPAVPDESVRTVLA